ncbi:MAG: translation initiation factor IF-2 [Patescibacteria group bacterium]
MSLQNRPPIVAVLGHVDHGKTSLLDKIRNTSVASREAGGITQSIGSWQVTVGQSSRESEANRGTHKKITFIDTPGHQAFNQMRSRGAKVADVAILVVAADDGVMPQTKESIEFLKAANTPFIVAINKIDLPGANIEAAKGALAKEEVLLEGRGGDTPVVEVSAKTGQGIDHLLEVIELLSEVQEVKADPEGDVEAVIVETERDPKRGNVLSSIVRNGTIRVGGELVSSETGRKVRIRGLFDENNKPIKEAGPGTPVEILGFDQLPPVGSVITSGHILTTQPSPTTHNPQLLPKKRDGFWVLLKADTAGSLEAVQGALGEKVGIIQSGVGDVVEADINLAASTGSPIVCFNIKLGKDIVKYAQEQGVKLYTYKIIYELLADVDKWQKELEEAQSEKILGKAQIIAQFPHEKETRIAGCRLESGRITKSDRLRLVREDKVLGTIRATSLKQQKQEKDKIDQGEFGMYFEPQLDFRIGDTLEAFIPPKTSTS